MNCKHCNRETSDCDYCSDACRKGFRRRSVETNSVDVPSVQPAQAPSDEAMPATLQVLSDKLVELLGESFEYVQPDIPSDICISGCNHQ